jgi:hypothetical protein
VNQSVAELQGQAAPASAPTTEWALPGAHTPAVAATEKIDPR